MEDLGQEESKQMGQPEEGLQCVFGERQWWGMVLTAVPLAWPCRGSSALLRVPPTPAPPSPGQLPKFSDFGGSGGH